MLFMGSGVKSYGVVLLLHNTIFVALEILPLSLVMLHTITLQINEKIPQEIKVPLLSVRALQKGMNDP